MINELVEFWTREATPIQALSQIVVYLAIGVLSAVLGFIIGRGRRR